MTFLAPEFLYAAVVAALAAVALHLITTREPRAMVLPTARFVPPSATEARVRTTRFSDPWLLALRVLLLLLVGAALARPVRLPQRERVARIILVDRSGVIGNDGEVRDSVRALYRPGDAIVAFDSTARDATGPDSVGARVANATGSLSAALVRAHAVASRIRAGTDSIELVVVSPTMAAEADRATARIRATWPGRARVVPVAHDTIHSSMPALVAWDVSARPFRAIARAPVDTIGGVVAGNDVVVASFPRRWHFPADSLHGATIIARWMDGEPAAVEWDSLSAAAVTCARSVSIPVDSTGDLVLRPDFVRLRGRLLGACGGPQSNASSAAASVASLIAGAGTLARASAFPPASAASSIAPWLLAAAIAVALAELLIRRRNGGGS